MDGNRLVDNREDIRVKYIHHTSKIDRIITETDQNVSPPVEIFGPEPQHNWCYYYQKITLAMQRGDFEEAARLADEASSLGHNPRNQSEWIPVLEAYSKMGRIDDARIITEELKKNEDLTYLYCSQSWNQNFEEVYALLCTDE
jgi:tetratricopeptide (TPR) repeat protein